MDGSPRAQGLRRHQIAAFLDVLLEDGDFGAGTTDGRMPIDECVTAIHETRRNKLLKRSSPEKARRCTVDAESLIDLVTGVLAADSPEARDTMSFLVEVTRENPALVERMYAEHPNAGAFEEAVSLARLTGHAALSAALANALRGTNPNLTWNGTQSAAALIAALDITPHRADEIGATVLLQTGLTLTRGIDVPWIEETPESDALQQELFDISDIRAARITLGKKLHELRTAGGITELDVIRRMVASDDAFSFDHAAHRLHSIESGAPNERLRTRAFSLLRAYDLSVAEARRLTAETFDQHPEARNASTKLREVAHALRGMAHSEDKRIELGGRLRQVRERRSQSREFVAGRLYENGFYRTLTDALIEIDHIETTGLRSRALEYAATITDAYDLTVAEIQGVLDGRPYEPRASERHLAASAAAVASTEIAPADERSALTAALELTGRDVLDLRSVLSFTLQALAEDSGRSGAAWCEESGIDPAVWDALVANQPADRDSVLRLARHLAKADHKLVARQLRARSAFTFDQDAADIVARRVRDAMNDATVKDLYATDVLQELAAHSFLLGGNVSSDVAVGLLARAGVAQSALGAALRAARGRQSVATVAWAAGIRAADWAALEVIGPDTTTIDYVTDALGSTPEALVARAGGVDVPSVPAVVEPTARVANAKAGTVR
ncbi:MAG: hypothetical protein ACOYNI_03545 [Acidimicrobiia bacterium]